MNRRDFLSKVVVAGVGSFWLPTSSLYASEISSSNDIYLSSKEVKAFLSVRDKLNQIRRYVGFGKFNIISFDYVLKTLRYSTIPSFTKEDFAFIDKIYYEDVDDYKFYGDKTSQKLTESINVKDVVKIEHSGHYLFRGKPAETYLQVLNDVGGDTLILTSGVRSIVKQMNLYLNKIYVTNFNVTKASFSIAPPSYSYHTVSDFDVGKKGWGYANFTSKFATTREFKELIKLDYIKLRYNKNNKDGVRFEPWHIEVNHKA